MTCVLSIPYSFFMRSQSQRRHEFNQFIATPKASTRVPISVSAASPVLIACAAPFNLKRTTILYTHASAVSTPTLNVHTSVSGYFMVVVILIESKD